MPNLGQETSAYQQHTGQNLPKVYPELPANVTLQLFLQWRYVNRLEVYDVSFLLLIKDVGLAGSW